MKKEHSLTIRIICILMLVAAGISIFTSVRNIRTYQALAGGYYSSPKYSQIEQVYDALINDYYIELDENAVIEGAIRGMLAVADDPYTFYYSAEDWSKTMADNRGEYAGLGIQILENEELTGFIVVRVFDDSPAEKAGLQVGDLIIAADDYSVAIALQGEVPANLGDEYDGPTNTTDLILYMRGEAGSQIDITVERKGEVIVLPVIRDVVHENRATSYVLDLDDRPVVGYIQLTEFEGDALTGVKSALEQFEAAGAEGIILDLRSNPGGDLDIVTQISDLFLPESMFVYLEDRHGNRNEFYSDANCWGRPLVILVDGYSASASELLTGAAQDLGVATVVGVTTFGKGIAQTLQPLSDGSAFQMTIARYYTPSGRVVQGNGITPDIVVEYNEDYDKYVAAEGKTGDYKALIDNDVQLAAAYEEVLRLIAEGWTIEQAVPYTPETAADESDEILADAARGAGLAANSI